MIGRRRRDRKETPGERLNALICKRFLVPVQTGTLDSQRLDGSDWQYRYRLVLN